MPRLKEISIVFGGKINISNYETVTVEIGLTATLAPGEDPAACEQQLWDAAQASVAAQVALLGKRAAGSLLLQVAQQVATPAPSPAPTASSSTEPPLSAYAESEIDELWDDEPDPAPAPVPSPHSGEYPTCPVHNVKMWPSKKTPGGFYHRHEGGYCER